MVDHGCAGDSLDLLLKLREDDPRVSVLSLSRNFGHSPLRRPRREHQRRRGRRD